ncbi:MAG: hypothetical protein J7497_15880, partial [Chitinophagaceae bacterium]|nr:hypothetical protein [Chitinophagaceae bacterium]
MADFNWTISVVMQVEEEREIEEKYSEFIRFINDQSPNPAIKYILLVYKNTRTGGQKIEIQRLVKKRATDILTQVPS